LPKVFGETEQLQEVEQEAWKVAEKKDDNDANEHRGKRHLALHVLVPAEGK
jgi:hypothetical protein